MQLHQKQSRGEKKRRFKRRKDEHVLSNVLSLRISDQEKHELEKITKTSSKSVSEIAREALEYWLSARRRYCLNT
ncbi:ribbon-helix-helix protein, copG family [Geobacter sp. OR-1]|uniref:ribbon-helix-helix protein, CopG family n=1 Tax=Geobacter sp. OR-1 TaxID=1266765 RepID=UPI000541ACA8|nr:ribbon-helix-helix protein, CopG family [Geobacter sp. OR-1]GAM11320.1 ribbon-helix-helix protein, copG family [Geobacter sp. OR-1]